jgi:hypothetical protein
MPIEIYAYFPIYYRKDKHFFPKRLKLDFGHFEEAGGGGVPYDR